jgi:N-methylhydantoinase A
MMSADRVPDGAADTLRFADMRYVGQGYTLEVPVPLELDEPAIAGVVQAFHDTHERVYGHSHPGAATEFVNVRVVQEWALPRPPLTASATPDSSRGSDTRQAYFDELARYVDTPIYQRAALSAGDEILGPAIVEQPDTTLVVYPEQRAVVEESGNVIVAVPARAGEALSAAVAS